jgi:hypothetical protein
LPPTPWGELHTVLLQLCHNSGVQAEALRELADIIEGER